MTEAKSNVIFIIGKPGCGKGTQCDRIAKTYDYVHLSTGDLLREETEKADSELGKQITEQMKNGSLVSTEHICKLIENAMEKDKGKKFLIDGFPRNKENVDGWKKTLEKKTNIQCVLFFDCDEKTSIDRCLKRGKDSGRTDDNEESLKKRLDTYHEETQPVVDLYEKEGLLKRIDASHDVDKVFNDVKNIMKDIK